MVLPAGSVEPDLDHVALRAPAGTRCPGVELGDRTVEVVDRHAVVVAGGPDAGGTGRRVDEMELCPAEAEPVAVDARDLGSRSEPRPSTSS